MRFDSDFTQISEQKNDGWGLGCLFGFLLQFSSDQHRERTSFYCLLFLSSDSVEKWKWEMNWQTWSQLDTSSWGGKGGTTFICFNACGHLVHLRPASEVWRRRQVLWDRKQIRTWIAQVWKIIPKWKWSNNTRTEQSQLLLGTWTNVVQVAGVVIITYCNDFL